MIGYAPVRDPLFERRLAEGEQVIGAKVSLGDTAAGPGEGVDEPRFAWLTDGMLLTSEAVDISRLARPRVEPKLAFRLGRTVRNAIPTAGEVLAATERVLPCLDVLSDDGSSTARLLVGEGVPPPPDGHLLRIRVQLRVDGPAPDPIGPSILGRSRVPALEAVSWLGGRMAERSVVSGAGTLLVSHAIGATVELLPGVRLIAHFSGVGTLRLEATAGP
jgi:2-keto-4-pentenoate hydratase